MKTLDARTRISLKNILYATDYSPAARAALPYALGIAQRYDSTVYVVHVRTPEVCAMAPIETWPALAEAAQKQEREEIAALQQQLGGFPHQVWIGEGDIWGVISRTIRENEINLLVIGTRGRTGLEKALLGSVAEQILRQATCPVLTVGPHASPDAEQSLEMREILCATDFSPESLAAVPYAVSLAQEHEAQLSLLYVLDRADATILHPELSAASLLHRLHELIPAEAELWCHPKCFVKHGSPTDQILELAKTRHADLIVLGVRRAEGHWGASTHLPWSTAHKVVSQAGCPVLTVRG
jgi:nucleotide-binding universal stress UspA family protein